MNFLNVIDKRYKMSHFVSFGLEVLIIKYDFWLVGVSIPVKSMVTIQLLNSEYSRYLFVC